MGDVAISIPVLFAFTRSYPEIKITILTKKQFTPLFRDITTARIISADFDKKHKGFFGLYELSRQIRKLNVDAVVDLHNVLRTNILKHFLPGIEFFQIDKARSQKKALINGSSFIALRTTTERYADVFRSLGLSLELTAFDFTPSKQLMH